MDEFADALTFVITLVPLVGVLIFLVWALYRMLISVRKGG